MEAAAPAGARRRRPGQATGTARAAATSSSPGILPAGGAEPCAPRVLTATEATGQAAAGRRPRSRRSSTCAQATGHAQTAEITSSRATTLAGGATRRGRAPEAAARSQPTSAPRRPTLPRRSSPRRHQRRGRRAATTRRRCQAIGTARSAATCSLHGTPCAGCARRRSPRTRPMAACVPGAPDAEREAAGCETTREALQYLADRSQSCRLAATHEGRHVWSWVDMEWSKASPWARVVCHGRPAGDCGREERSACRLADGTASLTNVSARVFVSVAVIVSVAVVVFVVLAAVLVFGFAFVDVVVVVVVVVVYVV